MPEEIYDTKSLSYFSLNDGQVIVRQTDGISHKWPIPQSHFHPLTRNYLKFALPSRAYASINSTGTLLLCKSDLFQ